MKIESGAAGQYTSSERVKSTTNDMIKKFDTDSDNSISKSEAGSEFDKIFSQIDSDGDEKLSANELNEAFYSRQRNMMAESAMVGLDTGKKGYLSADDLKGLSSDEFNGLDSDGNGQVSKEEIMASDKYKEQYHSLMTMLSVSSGGSVSGSEASSGASDTKGYGDAYMATSAASSSSSSKATTATASA